MPCENYREALIEAAATGAALSPDLRSHVDACLSCRAAFAEELRLFAAIDSGLHAAANAEVPPSFLPRVRARLEDLAAPRRRWMPSPIFAAAAVAIMLTAFIAAHPRHAVRDHSAKLIPATPSREASTTLARRDAARSPRRAASSPPNTSRPLSHPSMQEAASSVRLEVIVPPDEREALARFVAALQERSDVITALVTPVPEKTDEPMSVALLQIAKLEVRPLERIESEEPDSTEQRH